MKYHVRSISVCEYRGGQLNIWICLSLLCIHGGAAPGFLSGWQGTYNRLWIRQSRNWQKQQPPDSVRSEAAHQVLGVNSTRCGRSAGNRARSVMELTADRWSALGNSFVFSNQRAPHGCNIVISSTVIIMMESLLCSWEILTKNMIMFR